MKGCLWMLDPEGTGFDSEMKLEVVSIDCSIISNYEKKVEVQIIEILEQLSISLCKLLINKHHFNQVPFSSSNYIRWCHREKQ